MNLAHPYENFMEKTVKTCVICSSLLSGREEKFCSNTCKQKEKYARAMGRSCKFCYKKMKPKKVLGGFEQGCERKRCIASRKARA